MKIHDEKLTDYEYNCISKLGIEWGIEVKVPGLDFPHHFHYIIIMGTYHFPGL